ncbi:RNA polymerase sigma factor [Actinoplanes awajinensis]|uniref:RNA polymerase sigma factor n=1 Tax=Actinoplanes awajinensis TaxID=135946 RepID=UPI000A00BD5A|nr:sigma factor [Actinoplanes awajinensis]
MSDALLVVRCQLGERPAFAELVRAWHPAVERYVGRMLGAPDDDVVQEIWLAVVRGLPRLRQPDRFAPWLFVIARRAVMNRLREAYASPEPVDEPPPGATWPSGWPGSSAAD